MVNFKMTHYRASHSMDSLTLGIRQLQQPDGLAGFDAAELTVPQQQALLERMLERAGEGTPLLDKARLNLYREQAERAEQSAYPEIAQRRLIEGLLGEVKLTLPAQHAGLLRFTEAVAKEIEAGV